MTQVITRSYTRYRHEHALITWPWSLHPNPLTYAEWARVWAEDR